MKEPVETLWNDGYRQTSRKFCQIARVAISTKTMVDWFIKDNFGDANSGVPSLPISQQADHYRRVYSKDVIEDVPEKIMVAIRQKGT
ncbi:MAG: hypothetical protein ACUZ9M_00730 [Candidatus Scalindua sp.]